MDICYLVLVFLFISLNKFFIEKNPPLPQRHKKHFKFVYLFISLAAIMYDYSIFFDNNAKRPNYKYQI